MLDIHAERYVRALEKASRSGDDMFRTRETMTTLRTTLNRSDGITHLLHRADIVPGAAVAVADSLITSIRPTSCVEKLIRLLAQKHRLHLLPAITRQFFEYICRLDGIVSASVTSIRPLDDNEKEQITGHVQRLVGSPVHIEWYSDTSLLGGVIVRIGDRIIDGSLRTRIRKLHNTMVQTRKDRSS
ncbi:ATP synthase F1 subunit delta [bacterium]|nr:ATP synthase F1 subunit delta [candidate division CSSED10-310 bacterium]